MTFNQKDNSFNLEDLFDDHNQGAAYLIMYGHCPPRYNFSVNVGPPQVLTRQTNKNNSNPVNFNRDNFDKIYHKSNL